MTDNELIDGYDAYQAMRNLSDNTRRRRRWSLAGFADQLAYRARDLRSATIDDVELFLAGKGAPRTRAAVLGDLTCFYRWASNRGHVPGNPARAVDYPKIPQPQARPLSLFELVLAIRSAKPRLRVMLLLAAYAGLRVSEIAALRIADVDAARCVLIVREGKGGKDRIVPLHNDVVDALRVLPIRSDGRVIGTNGQNVSRCIRDHFELLGIDHRPHDLRATFATELAQLSNGNMPLVAGLLGHSSTDTTKLYTAWAPDGREYVEQLYQRPAA